MAEVTVTDIIKNFGKVEVLKNVSVRIEDGELLVILGPSGCGKSTLLRIIAGLETATSGDVFIGERRVNDLEPAERDIAMVFQNYALYPHMSVRQNMAYGLKNLGTPKPIIEERVADAAKILGLSDLLDRKPRQLSGGQRQRVAMGRAIVREPKAFLFDEPLSNLDAKLRVQMRHEIRMLQNRLKTTGIFVTHDQVEAMTLGDRLMVLNAGVVEQIGAPVEVYSRPASLFVAEFIGSPAMNLLDGEVDRDGKSVAFGGTRLALPHPVTGTADRAIRVGLRPEHLGEVVADGAATAAAGTLDVVIEWIELLGADTVAHGRLADGQVVTVRLAGDHPVQAGDRLALALAPANLHLFDKTSGARLRSAA
jgi:sn-glycerol 3-phosphate transport system ATP-binding protein